MEDRVTYFDFLRGIAIIMVIGIHTFMASECNDVDIYIRQMINCAVPIFLAISGYFLTKKRDFIFEKKSTFVRKQIAKVYIPMFIWSLPLFAISIYKGGGSALDIFKYGTLLLAGGYSIYYFITLIIQCYLLFGLFVKFNNLRGVIVSFAITCLSVGIEIYFMKFRGMEIPLLIYAGPIVVWCVYFMVGCYLAERNRYYKLWPILVLAIIFLIAQYFEAEYYNSLTSTNPYGVIKLSTVFFNCIMLFVLFSEKLEQLYDKYNCHLKLINLYGTFSFGIYLTHCYFLRFVLLNNWFLRWLVVAIISFTFIFLLNLIIPKRIQKYIGL